MSKDTTKFSSPSKSGLNVGTTLRFTWELRVSLSRLKREVRAEEASGAV